MINLRAEVIKYAKLITEKGICEASSTALTKMFK